MRIKKKLILIQGKIIIKERLIIPRGYTVHFNQGTEIILKKKDKLYLIPI